MFSTTTTWYTNNMEEYRITWSAPEHEHRAHTADWYWAVGIITVSLAIAFILLGNILLSLILIIGIGSLLLHARNPSQMVEHEISRNGIRSGNKLRPWHTLEAFWILEEQTVNKIHISPKLLLISEKPYIPQIVIPLDNAPLKEIHHVLAKNLEEVPQVEPFANRLMRMFGF